MRRTLARENRAALQWVVAPDPADSGAPTSALARELGLPPALVQILYSRGYTSAEAIGRFLLPRFSDLCDPFLLPNMQSAIERIVLALAENEKIMVFGDYDVDGLTASALLFLVFNRLGANVSNYVPNRLSEGYGLSPDGFLEAKRRGVTLVVSVDCGITAVDEVAFAREQGIDCVITDHHEPGRVLPKAVAAVNPKLGGEGALGEELSGVGLAFKVAQALYRRLGQDELELEEHLDLVALGTSADIVPLIGENRILTKFGLAQIAKTTKPGLKSLAFVAGLMGQEISTGQVVFVLAPRINAVGRLGDAEKAFKLLTTRDELVAAECARHLDAENRRRKDIDEKTLEEALELIEQQVDFANDRAIILASPGWHLGVIGIVASRLVERFHRPTVLIAIDGAEGKGSARSIPGFHLHDALKECQELLTRFGGHKYAAGLSLPSENIESFRGKLQRVSAERLSEEDLIPKLYLDAEVDFDQIDAKFVELVEQFAPFGPQNMRPTFVTRKAELFGQPQVVGNGHLKFKARQSASGGDRVFDCIGFGMGHRASELVAGRTKVDLAYVVEFNEWNGARRMQLRLKDLRLSG